jgi:hypothetical protein
MKCSINGTYLLMRAEANSGTTPPLGMNELICHNIDRLCRYVNGSCRVITGTFDSKNKTSEFCIKAQILNYIYKPLFL